MTAVNMIIKIFRLVDDDMMNMPKHSQARSYPSELRPVVPAPTIKTSVTSCSP